MPNVTIHLNNLPVRWGAGGRKVGEVVKVYEDGTVDLAITDPAVLRLLEAHRLQDYAIGIDPTSAVPREVKG